MTDLVTLSVDELKPGMFVQEVTQQTGEFTIKTQGRVSTKQAIQALRQKGIAEVIVDMSKSDLGAQEELPQHQAIVAQEHIPFEEEINRAASLYIQAKDVQQQLVNSFADGKPLDLEPAREISGLFVDSIQRNPNAMLCMTHIKEKDDYLLEHSLNVAILLASFSKFLGYDEESVMEIAFGGLLHDIGKVDIPDEILHKPGRLTPEEKAVMDGHVQAGIEALEYIPNVSQTLLDIVGLHHEKLDGTGYPNQISGDEISQFGRMVSIVDCYDAITAERCYKKGMAASSAMRLLLKSVGSHFDGTLVNQFIKCFGVYPVGTLVKLKSEKLALITELNEAQPLASKVKTFYSLRSNHFLPPKDIDLGAGQDKVLESIRAEDCNIDYKRFFAEQVMG
ncbi:MAG: DUF3391 domain-containing protein [Alteromonadaceae bacterium]|nr:DUF3391 domain-containing protein [Alteromonadaceae bacterium]